jgi:hypothetical protein
VIMRSAIPVRRKGLIADNVYENVAVMRVVIGRVDCTVCI